MKTLHRYTATVALFSAMLVAACANEVRDPYGNGGANLDQCQDEGCPEQSTTTSSVQSQPRAVAMLYSEVPWEPISGSGGTTVASSGSGGGIHPDTLMIFIRDDAASCTDPWTMQCGSHWGVGISIPPHLQTPGILQLSGPDLMSNMSVTGPNEGSNECWGGGGSFFSGTIEIISIDQGQVELKLDGTDTFDFDANGSYTASRCH